MIQQGIIQPGRVLGILLTGRKGRDVGKTSGVNFRERVVRLPIIGEVRVVKGLVVHVGIWEVGLVPIAGVALKLDHVGGVVGDDVHEDLDAAGMSVVDQTLPLGVGAQMRVDLLEVENPVAVITGGMAVQVSGVRLNRLVRICLRIFNKSVQQII